MTLTDEQMSRIVRATLDAGFDCAPNFADLFDVTVALIAEAVEQARSEVAEERDALAAAVDRIRRRHPRGDEEAGFLAPGLWCPTCGRERRDNGYGGCDDRQALVIPGMPIRGEVSP